MTPISVELSFPSPDVDEVDGAEVAAIARVLVTAVVPATVVEASVVD